MMNPLYVSSRQLITLVSIIWRKVYFLLSFLLYLSAENQGRANNTAFAGEKSGRTSKYFVNSGILLNESVEKT
jgi:hypothetical protein